MDGDEGVKREWTMIGQVWVRTSSTSNKMKHKAATKKYHTSGVEENGRLRAGAGWTTMGVWGGNERRWGEIGLEKLQQWKTNLG